MTAKALRQDRRGVVKNTLFVALIVFGNTVGNLLLAISMSQMPSFLSIGLGDYIALVLSNAFFLAGTFLITLSMFAQLSMYTWADLSYVLPVTASGYVLTAILSKFFLREDISISRWAGVVIISFGVFLVAHTPSRTKHLERTGK